jgi:hypothetical protein
MVILASSGRAATLAVFLLISVAAVEVATNTQLSLPVLVGGSSSSSLMQNIRPSTPHQLGMSYYGESAPTTPLHMASP